MNKKQIGIISGTLALVVGLGGASYVYANQHYQKGLAELAQHNWKDAKKDLEIAEKFGVLFFKDGGFQLQNAIHTYESSEYQLAKKAFQSADYQGMVKHLENIQLDSEIINDAQTLKDLDPRKVNVKSFLEQNVAVDKVKYVMLTPEIPGIIVEAYEGSGVFRTAHMYLIYYDPSVKKYTLGYHEAKKFYNQVSTQTGPIFSDNRNAVLVKLDTIGGSGWSTDVTVLGYDPNSHTLKKYLELPSIYKGSAEIRDGKRLIVHTFEQDLEYTWNGTQFEAKRVIFEPTANPNDITIHYRLSEDGQLFVSNQNVTLKIGQRLVLYRDDQLLTGKRILMSSNGTLDFDQSQSDTFIAKQAGTTDITIIPNGGYDWDHAKKIIVTVQ